MKTNGNLFCLHHILTNKITLNVLVYIKKVKILLQNCKIVFNEIEFDHYFCVVWKNRTTL